MKWLTGLGSSIYFLFFLIPLFSLMNSVGWEELIKIVDNKQAMSALWLSAKTAAAAVLVTAIAGVPTAYFLERNLNRARILGLFLELPIVLPPALAGMALLSAYGRQGLLGELLQRLGIFLPFTTVAVIMAQVFVAAPFFTRTVRSGVKAVVGKQEGAARVLGATEGYAFLTVVLPALMPSILAGGVLAWCRAMGEFGATLMFAGNLPGKTQTAALAVYGLMQKDFAAASALTVIMVAAVLLVLTIIRLLTRGGKLSAYLQDS